MPPRSTPNSPWTPWRWPSGDAAAKALTWPDSCITPTAACNTGRSATPNASPKPTRSLRSDLEGDSYDNALAEAFNSLFKAELIRNKGPWTGIDDLEIAVAEYIDWFNQRRLHGELGHVPPAEYEALHSTAKASPAPLKTS